MNNNEVMKAIRRLETIPEAIAKSNKDTEKWCDAVNVIRDMMARKSREEFRKQVTALANKEFGRRVPMSEVLAILGNPAPAAQNPPQKPPVEKQQYRRPVVCYTLSGEPVARYKSVSDACRELHISMGAIFPALCGKTKTSAGYQWRYEEEPAPGVLTERAINGAPKITGQHDGENRLVRAFRSKAEAARVSQVSLSRLNAAIKNGHQLNGYFWRIITKE